MDIEFQYFDSCVVRESLDFIETEDYSPPVFSDGGKWQMMKCIYTNCVLLHTNCVVVDVHFLVT